MESLEERDMAYRDVLGSVLKMEEMYKAMRMERMKRRVRRGDMEEEECGMAPWGGWVRYPALLAIPAAALSRTGAGGRGAS